MKTYRIEIKYNGQSFYKFLAELPDGATEENISVRLLPLEEPAGKSPMDDRKIKIIWTELP